MQSNTVVVRNGPVTNPPLMHIPPAVGNTSGFSGRHSLYKMSMAWLAVSIVLFIVGFSAPAWADIEGLWNICLRGICISSNMLVQDQPWFNAVRAMECLALAALIMCMIVEVYQDFYKRSTAEYFVVEMLAVIGGIFSFIGVIIYGVKMTEFFSRTPYPLGWGFGLTTAASSMILICAILMCCFRNKSPLTNSASRAYISSCMGHHGGYASGYNGGYVYAANNQSAQPHLYPATTSIENQFSYPAMSSQPPYQKGQRMTRDFLQQGRKPKESLGE